MTRLRQLLLLILTPLRVLAELNWRVWAWYEREDVDEDEVIDVSEFNYIVSNLSPPGDANNLVTFTVLAGANAGVYLAAAPTGP